jgi:plasmid stabilization system protein ParE
MSRLIWSLQARQDLQRLKRFLADKNADAARRAVKAIRESVKVLAHPPGIGRPVEDMEPEYREWLINFADSCYVALYRWRRDRSDPGSAPPERGWLLTDCGRGVSIKLQYPCINSPRSHRRP